MGGRSTEEAAMRAFIAVALPEEVLGRCGQMQECLRALELDGRFAAPQSIHLASVPLGGAE